MSATEWTGRHPTKDQLRAEVWAKLRAENAAVGDPVGHIPNFVGAAEAAERLASLPLWQQAQVIKCNPDKSQMPVRLRALQDGKRLYMAVPRLTSQTCFVELFAPDLQAQGIDLAQAATARHALMIGKRVAFSDMGPIDLVLVGCVAVSLAGGRTGKGAGFADLELAMLRQFELVQATTPIATTVHELQIVGAERLPMERHDWALSWIITPARAIPTQTAHPQPAVLDWDAIQPDQYRKIPILRQLRPQNERG
jgi:5-formyltetrahydrofolate cyclo-ligase